MTEMLDIYDANMAHVGTASRARAHAEGHWHRVVHIWLASEARGGSLLYQLRAPSAASFPGCWDATVGGHLRAGEGLEEGFREAEEELGVALAFAEAHFLGLRIAVSNEGEVRNREFQAVYLMRAPEPFVFAPKDGEAGGVGWVPNAAALALHAGRVAAIEIDAVLARDDGVAPARMTLTRDSFVPGRAGYHATMHIMAERMLEGRTDLAV